MLLECLILPTIYAAVFALPTVHLDHAKVTGITTGNVAQFLGIPFAKPPVGQLRFRLPQAIGEYEDAFNATSFGPACPQQTLRPTDVSGLPLETLQVLASQGGTLPDSEDCLSINVLKPVPPSRRKLPVLVWIFGGGFEIGGTAAYDGTGVVERSIAIGEPIIYVSMNYRVSAFGFLASKEVKQAGVGNLGLHDQREALRWVHKYIGAFGGDPSKVTIWGESAGAISVSLHMIMFGGNTGGLFRAGIMQSGAPPPLGDIELGQPFFNDIVTRTGCMSASDTLECLRVAPYDDLKAAMSAQPGLFDYEALTLSFAPRSDGLMFSEPFFNLVEKRQIAHVPIINGNCDDEGTLFSLNQRALITDADMKEYLRAVTLRGMSENNVDTIMELYPNSPPEGAPFDTGSANQLTPQFKRFAAFIGDLAFQAPRRFFFDHLPRKQDVYTYLSKRGKAVPFLGAFHSSDLSYTYGPGGDLADYLIRFTVTMDPNGYTGITWPKRTKEGKEMLAMIDGDVPFVVMEDTFREQEMEALSDILLDNPI